MCIRDRNESSAFVNPALETSNTPEVPPPPPISPSFMPPMTTNTPSSSDNAIAEYFSAKKTKLNAVTLDERKVSVQQFVNSLLPDLMSMNDVQLKAYKRRSLQLIDEILGTNNAFEVGTEAGSHPASSVVQAASPVGTYFSSFSDSSPSPFTIDFMPEVSRGSQHMQDNLSSSCSAQNEPDRAHFTEL